MQHEGRLGALLVLLLCALWAGSSAANEGKPIETPPTRIDGGGELRGLETVTVVQEQLEFDFRPLDQGELPTVRATYRLNNAGPPVETSLVFASFDIESGHVRFDGAEVAVQQRASDELPRGWATPNGPVDSVTHGEPGASGLAFELAIPPGAHELEVVYRLAGDWDEWSANGHDVRYALNPARSWKEVKSLDVTIHVPDTWRLATKIIHLEGKIRVRPDEPPLKLTDAGNGVWTSHYDGLPSDELTFTLKRRNPTAAVAWRQNVAMIGQWALPALCLLLGAVAVGLPRAIQHQMLLFLLMFVVTFAACCSFAPFMHRTKVLLEGQESTYGALASWFDMGMRAVVVIAVLLVIALVTWLVRRALAAKTAANS